MPPRNIAVAGVAAAESKQNVFDHIYTIIFLALAVFIFLRLRSVLGQRTGRERPPYEPYKPPSDAARTGSADNVVSLPGRVPGAQPSASESADPAERWRGLAEPGSVLALGLDAVMRADTSFDPKQFLGGARAAYEMIVTAYSEGDRGTLKNMLSREVYDGFEGVIVERESRGETSETKFVSIDKAELAAAELKGSTAQVTARFVSQLVSVTRDRSGAVIDGSSERVTEVTDVWTFARDTSSRDPNWKLVATEGGQ